MQNLEGAQAESRRRRFFRGDNMVKKKKNVINKLKNEIIGLILLSIGFYSIFSIIVNNPGKIGMLLKFFFGFLFGQGSIVFSLIIIIIAISIIIKSKPFKWNRKVLALIIVGVNYCILKYVFIVEDILSGSFDIQAIFYITWGNASLNIEGGFIGLILSYILTSLLSQTGTIIILVLITIIAFIIFTQKSFMTFIKECLNNIKEWINKAKKKLFVFSSRANEKEIAIHSSVDSDIDSNSIDDSKNIKGKIDEIDEKIKILDYTQKDILNIDKNNEKDKQSISDEESLTNHPYTSNYKSSKYSFPPIDILNKPIGEKAVNNKRKVLNNARILEKTLTNFGVQAKVVQVNMGPTITRYELQPSPGVKVSKIVSLTDDIALNLAASGVRVEAPIPGKAAIGIEVPNQDTSIVFIRELLEDDCYKNFTSNLAFAVGKDITGKVKVSDIAKMPHMLIAGATGSGKSVCINSLITSILYKSTPEQVRLLLIDPKVVELSIYNGIPHLLIPVVTDPKKASGALNWVVQEMTERYKKFAEYSVRDLSRYNEFFNDEPEKKMPQILVIIDELADLMMVSPHEVEDSICRLAQMARAAGIHLVVATQRPSVDVITGVIKANIPSRIAFAVSSHMDSRTILDMGGAEKLLGRGDMLFYPVGEPKPLRVQGAFISDKEVEKIVEYIKSKNTVSYDNEILEEIQHQDKKQHNIKDEDDELLPKAIELAIDNQQISISMLQRRLRIGYARAARIIDEMENRNIIGGYEGSKPRKVLIKEETNE